MNILAIGAHFDDVELGCGGALARHSNAGDNVIVFIATESGYKNQNGVIIRDSKVAEQEGRSAMRELGISELFCGGFKTLEIEFTDDLNRSILHLVEKFKIDMVYSHWLFDVHHDHQAVARAAMHSCRHVNKFLMYRSNWYHSPLEFKGNFYIDISDYWKNKELAIRAHVSEFDRVGGTWLKFFKNEAQNAGQKIGVELAESFEVLKYLY